MHSAEGAANITFILSLPQPGAEAPSSPSGNARTETPGSHSPGGWARWSESGSSLPGNTASLWEYSFLPWPTENHTITNIHHIGLLK